MYRKKILALVVLTVLVLSAKATQARENVTDWYIKDFDTKIVANKDSSLNITETITADCGKVIDKHGIFRILPENVNISGKKIKTPVQLLSIVDGNGNPVKYSETKNADTVTWKIGDPNITVQGVNVYKISYIVQNAIRFGDPKFDELYWNLNGNFWELETDHLHAQVVFPKEVGEENSDVEYYAGDLGSKGKELAKYQWSAPNVLEIESVGMLAKLQGVTISVAFPKNIFVEYKPGFWETYGQYFYLIIPLVVFLVCFCLWYKFGKDPKIDKPIIAEYGIPGNLSPIELGVLMKNGSFNNEVITAEIINLAAKGFLTIRETHEKILFFDTKDYELTKTQGGAAEGLLSKSQQLVLDGVFEKGDVVKLSSLKNSFYKKLSGIKKAAIEKLSEDGLIVKSGLAFKTAFLVFGGTAFFVAFSFGPLSSVFGAAMFLSAIIIFVFGIIMPRRTPKGADLYRQSKGFKLFMETVDKDRAAFYEKENIFEKFLPYAIVFGITGIWVKRMREIYGEEYFATYTPVWYASSVGTFDADSFTSSMDSLSSAIAANTSAPSGSGGGGGAGGGGGGGGGGGW